MTEPTATNTVGDRELLLDGVAVVAKNWRRESNAALAWLDIGSAWLAPARHSRRIATGKNGNNNVDI